MCRNTRQVKTSAAPQQRCDAGKHEPLRHHARPQLLSWIRAFQYKVLLPRAPMHSNEAAHSTPPTAPPQCQASLVPPCPPQPYAHFSLAGSRQQAFPPHASLSASMLLLFLVDLSLLCPAFPDLNPKRQPHYKRRFRISSSFFATSPGDRSNSSAISCTAQHPTPSSGPCHSTFDLACRLSFSASPTTTQACIWPIPVCVLAPSAAPGRAR